MSQPDPNSKRFSSIEELSAKITKAISKPVAVEYSDPDTEPSRQKTRFLNFKSTRPKSVPVGMQAYVRDASEVTEATLTILDGPGAGTTFLLDKPFMSIGRGEAEDVRIDFGDDSISRQGHASIAYYGEESGYVIRDGMKPNPIFHNEAALQGERDLTHGDQIRIGETILQFKLV